MMGIQELAVERRTALENTLPSHTLRIASTDTGESAISA